MAATGVGELLPSGHHGLREPVEEGEFLSVERLRLVVRRHLAGVQYVEYLLPPFGRCGTQGCGGGQRVEPDATAGLVRGVAADAVFRQESGGRSAVGRCRLRCDPANHAHEACDRPRPPPTDHG